MQSQRPLSITPFSTFLDNDTFLDEAPSLSISRWRQPTVGFANHPLSFSPIASTFGQGFISSTDRTATNVKCARRGCGGKVTSVAGVVGPLCSRCMAESASIVPEPKIPRPSFVEPCDREGMGDAEDVELLAWLRGESQESDARRELCESESSKVPDANAPAQDGVPVVAPIDEDVAAPPKVDIDTEIVTMEEPTAEKQVDPEASKSDEEPPKTSANGLLDDGYSSESDLTPIEETDDGETEIDPSESDEEKPKPSATLDSSRPRPRKPHKASDRSTLASTVGTIDPSLADLPPGYRRCAVKDCMAILSPEYRWKSCDSCRTTAREYQRSRKMRKETMAHSPDLADASELSLTAAHGSTASNDNAAQGKTEFLPYSASRTKPCLNKMCDKVVPYHSRRKWCNNCSPPRPATESEQSHATSRPAIQTPSLLPDGTSASHTSSTLFTKHRRCGSPNCYAILPSFEEYRYKLCERCRYRTRMKARQKRTEELAGEPISGSSLPGASHEDSDDDDHTKGEKHGHYRASVYGAAATTIQETSQAIACVNNWCRNFNPGHRSRPACEACRIREQVPTFAPPIASHKRKRKLTESLPTREPLNPAFAGGPLESGWFVPTGLPSLPQSTIHVPIPQSLGIPRFQHVGALTRALQDSLRLFIRAHAHHLDTVPVIFDFSGEFSLVSQAQDGDATRCLNEAKKELEDTLCTTLSVASAFQLNPDGIRVHHRCIQKVAVATEVGVDKMIKLAGEIEITVTADNSHRFFPGQRVVIQLRLVG